MSTFNPGDTVRVLPPFADAFPGDRTVTEVVVHEDSSIAYILGECGGFDAMYLESAA